MKIRVRVPGSDIGPAVDAFSRVGRETNQRHEKDQSFLTYEVADDKKEEFVSRARELGYSWNEV